VGDPNIVRRIHRRLIVFDLDGTLVDSRRDLADAANAVLAAYGADPLSEELIGRMVGEGAATLIARAFAAARREQPVEALDRFLAIYDEHLLRHTRPYPKMPDVLAELQTRARLAVLTNKPLGATRRMLAGLDLARYFADDDVVGGDGPFPRKPDPAGLQHLMKVASATADETVLVGDSPIDWRTARNAGVTLYLARYGFGCEQFPFDQFADGVMVDRPYDLRSVL
jgi:phosphoglycolate phosphatase